VVRLTANGTSRLAVRPNVTFTLPPFSPMSAETPSNRTAPLGSTATSITVIPGRSANPMGVAAPFARSTTETSVPIPVDCVRYAVLELASISNPMSPVSELNCPVPVVPAEVVRVRHLQSALMPYRAAVETGGASSAEASATMPVTGRSVAVVTVIGVVVRLIRRLTPPGVAIRSSSVTGSKSIAVSPNGVPMLPTSVAAPLPRLIRYSRP
jgi:hypothetical protein